MTAVTAALAPAGQGLMDDYLGYLRISGLGERAVRDRVRIARDFLGPPSRPAGHG